MSNVGGKESVREGDVEIKHGDREIIQLRLFVISHISLISISPLLTHLRS
jgi:hypothetical protein